MDIHPVFQGPLWPSISQASFNLEGEAGCRDGALSASFHMSVLTARMWSRGYLCFLLNNSIWILFRCICAQPKNYISQSHFEVRLSVWLSYGQWNASRSSWVELLENIFKGGWLRKSAFSVFCSPSFFLPETHIRWLDLLKHYGLLTHFETKSYVLRKVEQKNRNSGP